MKQITANGIILSRINYGEADRIITFITDSQGKLKAIAKGVRKTKSKLAGGIELFSVSELTYIIGRGEIKTLISTRLVRHYALIVKDLERTAAAYDLIKILNKATEDAAEDSYFYLLDNILEALNDVSLDIQLVKFWFNTHLLKLAGHTPNLFADDRGNKLAETGNYIFDLENMNFNPSSTKPLNAYNTQHIKFLRLANQAAKPKILAQVQNYEPLVKKLLPLTDAMLKSFIRV